MMDQSGTLEMKKRRIALKDGRYLIFYTFENQPQPANAEGTERPEPQARPQAEDERSV
jgi:hypothetical protein